jgi:Short C-terminal domain
MLPSPRGVSLLLMTYFTFNYILLGIERDREVSYSHMERPQQPQQSSISVADELMELANLKEKGIISDEEFQQIKQDLIKKKI